MSTVSRNILANFAGWAWTKLKGIAFVSVYLRLLGIEAYGLIGFFLTLQSVLGIMGSGSGSDSHSRSIASLLARVASQTEG